MEIVLCVFLGLWISGAGILAYYWIKKEMSSYIDTNKDKENKQ